MFDWLERNPGKAAGLVLTLFVGSEFIVEMAARWLLGG